MQPLLFRMPFFISKAISYKSIISPIIHSCIPCVAIGLISKFGRFFNRQLMNAIEIIYHQY